MSIQELVYDIMKAFDDAVIDGENNSQTVLDMIKTIVEKILNYVKGIVIAD